jgi:hypothetical protein
MQEIEIYDIKNLKIMDYHHGGSRIFLEENNNRVLICDTYGDSGNKIDQELKSYIIEAIKKYLRRE